MNFKKKDFFIAKILPYLDNTELLNALFLWGKRLRLELDQNSYYLDFSNPNKASLISEIKMEKEVDFTFKSTTSSFMNIFFNSGSIDPLEAYTQGLFEIEGSMMDAMEFAEIISSYI